MRLSVNLKCPVFVAVGLFVIGVQSSTVVTDKLTEGTNKVPIDVKNSESNTDISTNENGFYRVLAVLPYQGLSHQMFFHAVLRTLLRAGHHVTTVTTVQMKENFTNHRQILFDPSIASWTELFEFEVTAQSGREARVDLERLAESFMFPLYGCEEFRRLLQGEEQFDLVILEPFFMQEALVFLGHRFNCPIVALSTAVTETNQDLYMGRMRNPAVEPEWTTCATSQNMDFYQRAANTFSLLVNILEHRFYYLPKRERDLYRLLHYPGMESTPPIRQLLQDISLTLANTHPLLTHPTPLPQNLIMVPGLHLGSSDNALSQEWQVLMDGAKDGVILFTMGTMVPVSKMKEEREIFIKTFSKLHQLVLWKSDVDLENLPANIKTFKWVPQRAILGHKKCVLFITHGGMMGKQEALYYGVPLVSIPLFGDQPANTGHSQASGLGLTLQYRSLTVTGLYNAITTVINDNQYRERLSRYSKVFRESVARSESEVLRWTEHVVRHDGAGYLRSTVRLYWFQYYLLDVFLLFLLIIVLCLLVLIKCAQGFYRLRFPAAPTYGQDKLKRQ